MGALRRVGLFGILDDSESQAVFRDFIQLIKGAKLVITNDSAGLHLGVTLGRPVMAIAGGGLPER